MLFFSYLHSSTRYTINCQGLHFPTNLSFVFPFSIFFLQIWKKVQFSVLSSFSGLDRQTDGRTDRQTDRRTDRQTGRHRQTDGWTRRTDRQTDGHRRTDGHKCIYSPRSALIFSLSSCLSSFDIVERTPKTPDTKRLATKLLVLGLSLYGRRNSGNKDKHGKRS